MAAGIDSVGLSPVARIDAAATIAVIGGAGDTSLRRLAALETGRTFEVQVLSRLSNGDFAVGIADTVARMALPAATHIGDQLSMTLLAQTPRPLFKLEPSVLPDSTVPNPTARMLDTLLQTGTVKTTLASAPALASAALSVDVPTAASDAVLSPTARLIDTLLQTAPAKAALAGVVPLAPTAAAIAPDTLAGALQHNLTTSGLFYESHVSEWAQGTRTIEQLKQEPQMRGPSIVAAVVGDSPSDAKVVSADTQVKSAPILNGDMDVNKRMAMQLDTLDQRQVTWQGELIPGQPMQWQVRENHGSEHPSSSAAESVERTWQSVLKLDLPNLGPVAATLDVRGDRVQLRVRTDNAASAGALQAQTDALVNAMSSAGLPLELVLVKHEVA